MAAADPEQLAPELYVALVRIIRDLRREAPSEGVAASGLSALFTLAKSGPMRASALAEAEGVSAASMTRIVDRICELGLVARSADPSDGRAHLVSLTRAGRKAVEQGREARLSVVRRRLDALSKADREVLAASLPVLGRLAGQQ